MPACASSRHTGGLHGVPLSSSTSVGIGSCCRSYNHVWATQAGFGHSNARAEGMRTARSSQLGATQLISLSIFFFSTWVI